MYITSAPNKSLELLCLLSAWPAPVRMLAADLGVTVADLYGYVRRLREQYGIEVVVEHDRERQCRMLSLDGRSWRQAQQLADIYWERRYRDGNHRDPAAGQIAR